MGNASRQGRARNWTAALGALVVSLLVGVACFTGCAGGSSDTTGGGGSSSGGTDGTTCSNTQTDPNNCGKCGNVCMAAQVCNAGACASMCGAGSMQCGQSCVNTMNDNANCGGCGKACTMGQVCSGGKCGATCGGGTMLCGSMCVDTQHDPDNCGGCGTTCAPGRSCVKGACANVCGNETYCSVEGGAGYCANTQTDNANCGTCGNACPQGEVCSAGQCGNACGGGETLCAPDGGAPYCANTGSDNQNCGGCGNVCGNGQVCQGGSCQNGCVGPDGGTETLCAPEGGAPYCANTDTDNANCGGCGVVCLQGQTCQNGGCVNGCIGPDGGPETLCGGDGGQPYCADTNVDNNNCGGCGTVCGVGYVCQGGSCVNSCPSQDGGTLTLCTPDGGQPYCADTNSDPNNCGGCGVACSGNQACIGGNCVGLGGCAAVSFANSYAASSTFTDGVSGDTCMTFAFDGTNGWSTHGGSPSFKNEGEYDTNNVLLSTYQPNLDFRSIFTVGSTVEARGYASATIYKQTSPGVLASLFTLSGGALDSQAAVVYDSTVSEYVENDYGSVNQWSSGGTFVSAVSLTGWGSNNETAYPQGRGMAVSGNGCWLTYSNGTLSAWSHKGTRLATTTLTGAGVSFDSHFSLSYARGLVWVVDVAGGTWRGYNVGL